MLYSHDEAMRKIIFKEILHGPSLILKILDKSQFMN